MRVKQLAIILFYLMFIYSGVNKIFTFNKKVTVLANKTGLPNYINVLGMIGVIILEILGSLILIINSFDNKIIDKKIIKFTNILFLLFLIVVTLLYHPPNKKIIPFLSNLTTFSGILYMYGDLI